MFGIEYGDQRSSNTRPILVLGLRHSTVNRMKAVGTTVWLRKVVFTMYIIKSLIGDDPD